MSQESTTPDLAELVRRCFEAISAGDLDEAQRVLTHDAVLDMTRTIGVVVDGRDAIRAFEEDWLAGYEEVAFAAEEIIDAGNGVAFVRQLQTARPTGTAGLVTQREANVWITEDGRVVRVIVYPDSEIDEARAAAERLAEERGQAVPSNLDLVRSIYADWERGDFSSIEWADPEIDFAFADGPEPGRWTGLQDMSGRYGDWLGAWKDFRAEPEEYVVVDDHRILVLVHNSARGRTSGVELEQRSVANFFEIRDGRITQLVIYLDRDRAFADLGLAG